MLFLILLHIFVKEIKLMNQIGCKIIHLTSVDSTSNYVANLQKEGVLAHGTAIIADEQTQGRGQRGTVWNTSPGLNLTMSFYVEHSDLLIENQTSIHHWVAVSVVEFLRKLGVDTSIKWPNDILAGSGKMAGILIENALAGKFIKSSIIGIGLNVNQTDFGDVNGTSIKLETGNNFPIEEIAQKLLQELDQQYSRLTYKAFKVLKAEYLKNLWGMNQEVRFIRNNQLEKGTILGVNDGGLLEIQTQHGIEYFDLKEVKFMLD
jgi:BirA family biotin operon repressor/biotin-[acetyl-CoA-carboxylase] ligase